MACLIDMTRKEWEPKGSWTHFVTLNSGFTHDLDLGIFKVKKKKAVSQELEGWLTKYEILIASGTNIKYMETAIETWNIRDVSQ